MKTYYNLSITSKIITLTDGDKNVCFQLAVSKQFLSDIWTIKNLENNNIYLLERGRNYLISGANLNLYINYFYKKWLLELLDLTNETSISAIKKEHYSIQKKGNELAILYRTHEKTLLETLLGSSKTTFKIIVFNINIGFM